LNKKLKFFGISNKRIIVFFLLSIVTGLLEGFGLAMFLPLLQFIEEGQQIGKLTENSNLWYQIENIFSYLNISVNIFSLGISVMILMFLRVFFNYIKQLYVVWFSHDIRHRTRVNLFKTLALARFDFFETTSSSEIINLVSVEATRTSGFFSGLLQLVSNLFMISVMIFVLLYISFDMTIWVITIVFVVGLISIYAVKSSKSVSFDTTNSNKYLADLLVEKLSSLKLLKLSAYEERELKKYSKLSNEVKNNLFRLSKYNANIDLIIEPAVIVVGFSLIILSVNQIGLSIAELGVFGVTLLRILPNAKEVIKSWQSSLSNYASIRVVLEFSSQAKKNAEPRNKGYEFKGINSGISYENVSFKYPNGKIALELINAFIPKGKITALVGKSGSGKSTFVNMLPRLRNCSSGKIKIDGVDINEINISSLRKGISFVSQDTEILNQSIRDNLLFVSPDSTDEDINNVLKKTSAFDFVRKLPKGLDTILGERGLRLSGGERQRLSLARALLRKGSILILDEPTSALDVKTEKAISKTLRELSNNEGLTIIVIAHRLSTIRDSDNIIVIDSGKILECGNHKSLMHNDAWYAEFVNAQ